MLKNIKINCPHNTVQIDVLKIKPTVLYDTKSVIRKHFSTKSTVQYKPGQAELAELCPPPDYISSGIWRMVSDILIKPFQIFDLINLTCYITRCNKQCFPHHPLQVNILTTVRLRIQIWFTIQATNMNKSTVLYRLIS